MPGLPRPDGLGDEEWASISDAEGRLQRADRQGDFPLVVGSAKDLCETIARVVVAERGIAVGSRSDMSGLITQAHKSLEFQPGEGLAADQESRKIAQSVKQIVIGLSDLRNRLGTGHGRAVPTGITQEHAELAWAAAHLWSAWALRRLEPYIAGDVTALVRDLDGSIFHRGELARRLLFANLPHLPADEQRRLGIAVARRASSGTFVVYEDGIEAARPEELDAWPYGYVDGLIIGLFLDRNGYVDIQSPRIEDAARLLAALTEPAPVLQHLHAEVANADLSSRLANDDETRQATIDELRRTADMLPDGLLREIWRELTSGLERTGEEG